jgi:hypothetical protein
MGKVLDFCGAEFQRVVVDLFAQQHVIPGQRWLEIPIIGGTCDAEAQAVQSATLMVCRALAARERFKRGYRQRAAAEPARVRWVAAPLVR